MGGASGSDDEMCYQRSIILESTFEKGGSVLLNHVRRDAGTKALVS